MPRRPGVASPGRHSWLPRPLNCLPGRKPVLSLADYYCAFRSRKIALYSLFRWFVITGRTVMVYRISIGIVALAAALTVGNFSAPAQDLSKYPDWKGAWSRLAVPGVRGQPSFDQTKSWGF